MPDKTDSIQEQLAALRRGFVEQLPQRMAAIEAAAGRWLDGDAAHLGEYHRLVHSLTGAGATFGQERISQVARRLERHLKQLFESQAVPVAEQLAEAGLLLDEVRAAVGGAAQGAAPAEPRWRAETSAQSETAPLTPRENDSCLTYLLGNEETLSSGLEEQLRHFGYLVESFASAAALRAAVARRSPAMLLADIALREGERAGIAAVTALQEGGAPPIPVIFVSGRTDFDTRLAAVRAGGVTCLPKPLSIEHLVDVMDGLAEQGTVEPLRILVVDDEPDLAHRSALLLRDAGMVVEMVTDSMRVFDTLAEFSPELILMDMHMPRCNGQELAAVIRQLPDYVGVPIVFLSSETDRTAQLAALRVGGDDFLTKPISPSELIQSVTIRAERYRTLRSLMSRDSLTGLLNHTRIMESLEQEVARAERYGASLCFAMIDIDHFKRVNDSHGHAAGDTVIKSLARLLQQRLRKTDIVGRYGGEEFAVIMPETPLTGAVRVMEELRRLFGEVVHQAGGASFSVTFSCGVAAMPPAIKVNTLYESADKRLYLAKAAGRNRVTGSDT